MYTYIYTKLTSYIQVLHNSMKYFSLHQDSFVDVKHILQCLALTRPAVDLLSYSVL